MAVRCCPIVTWARQRSHASNLRRSQTVTDREASAPTRRGSRRERPLPLRLDYPFRPTAPPGAAKPQPRFLPSVSIGCALPCGEPPLPHPVASGRWRRTPVRLVTSVTHGPIGPQSRSDLSGPSRCSLLPRCCFRPTLGSRGMTKCFVARLCNPFSQVVRCMGATPLSGAKRLTRGATAPSLRE